MPQRSETVRCVVVSDCSAVAEASPAVSYGNGLPGGTGLVAA